MREVCIVAALCCGLLSYSGCRLPPLGAYSMSQETDYYLQGQAGLDFSNTGDSEALKSGTSRVMLGRAYFIGLHLHEGAAVVDKYKLHDSSAYSYIREEPPRDEWTPQYWPDPDIEGTVAVDGERVRIELPIVDVPEGFSAVHLSGSCDQLEAQAVVNRSRKLRSGFNSTTETVLMEWTLRGVLDGEAFVIEFTQPLVGRRWNYSTPI